MISAESGLGGHEALQIVQVALDTPLDRLFDYLAPDALARDIGRRVTVPFGRQQRLTGVIMGLTEESALPTDSLKAVLAIDRLTPPLPPDLLQLAQFASGYYHHPLGAVLATILPPALRRARLSTRSHDAREAYALSPDGQHALADLPGRARAQRALFARLAQGPLARQQLSAREKQLVKSWLDAGWLEKAWPSPDATHQAESAPSLTDEQAAALQALRAMSGFTPWLLHGVTGSGKTEVYLQHVAHTLAAGRQALILVPEIHLTPQLTERFSLRFPGRRLLSLHSGLAEGERGAAWLAALHGRADIVLGTRLAVFTPMPRLGLIIVDEEHDTAFKQMEGMRYSARDVAVWRARQRDVPIVLGSATPALESWRNAREGRYRLLSLTRRASANAVLPTVRVIDSRTDRPKNGLTQAVLQGIDARLQRGEQSLVFINRRGYAPTLLCNGCGRVFACTRCSAHLVLHRTPAGHRLLCHHCGLMAHPPEVCPDCGNLDLRPAGQGTQRVEETLMEHFPQARLLRIDRDTTSRKGSFAAMRQQVEAREVDILVGTQIVAKGHDFPHLTLVGVIGADLSLVSPDFRAGERLFAQLMQVAGRAGRAAHPGEVLIQTTYPLHPLYRAVAAHDYAGYAALSLKERRDAGFPPFASQALLRAEGRHEAAVSEFLLGARTAGEALTQRVALFDPVPALMSRIAHQHRMQLLVQADLRADLQGFLGDWLNALRALPAKGVRWSLDVDPLDV